MKSLQYFIKTLNFNFFERHLMIEELIYDLYNSKVNENKTKFEDELKFCYSIIKTIHNNWLNNRKNKIILYKNKELKDWKFPIIFFEKLVINICDDEENGYIISESSLNKKTKLFNQVVLKIHMTGKIKMLSYLLHELCHAWDNYEAQLNDSSLAELMITNISEVDFTDLSIDKIYERQKYFLDKYENKAFLKQFTIMFAGNTHLTFEEAKSIFKSNKYVKGIVMVFAEWKNICKDSKLKEKLLNYVNLKENSNLSWLEYSKEINKKIEKLSHDLISKMIEAFDVWNKSELLKNIDENRIITNNIDKSINFECKIDNMGKILNGLPDIVKEELDRLFEKIKYV